MFGQILDEIEEFARLVANRVEKGKILIPVVIRVVLVPALVALEATREQLAEFGVPQVVIDHGRH